MIRVFRTDKMEWGELPETVLPLLMLNIEAVLLIGAVEMTDNHCHHAFRMYGQSFGSLPFVIGNDGHMALDRVVWFGDHARFALLNWISE